MPMLLASLFLTHHVEDVVLYGETKPRERPGRAQTGEAGAEGRGGAGRQRHRVRRVQRGQAAEAVGHVAEDQLAHHAAHGEQSLGEGNLPG